LASIEEMNAEGLQCFTSWINPLSRDGQLTGIADLGKRVADVLVPSFV
jgi:hypothetical protein